MATSAVRKMQGRGRGYGCRGTAVGAGAPPEREPAIGSVGVEALAKAWGQGACPRLEELELDGTSTGREGCVQSPDRGPRRQRGRRRCGRAAWAVTAGWEPRAWRCWAGDCLVASAPA